MKTAELAPGTILQQMYLNERLARREMRAGRFLDLGAGTGHASSVLLARGWQGVGIDLNETACAKNSATNQQYVVEGSYEVRHGDFLAMPDLGRADLVVSSMVLEHLEDQATDTFFAVARTALGAVGSLVLMVPGSPRHWGIEDEIAGHIRRFDEHSVREELHRNGFKEDHVAGLTFPISNVLLPLSNFLVKRAERQRVDLSQHDRTVLAGDRQVLFKTAYPASFHWVLNTTSMYPFHTLQKVFRHRPSALVVYAEAHPAKN